MSAKILHSLTDEKPDLHKQIGCMSGIFQLFDRHHFISGSRGGRRVNGRSQKRLPQGENGKQTAENNGTLQKHTDKNRKKVVKEKQRNSTESSRATATSSSCSSSFSSAQQEPLPSQTISNVNQPNASNAASMHQRRQSFDMQDLIKESHVKESTHGDPHGVSVKPAAKDGGGHTLKYIDSPRPSHQAKSVKPRVSGANESFQVPAKFQEAPWSSSEERNCSGRLVPKDARRFSYDGREWQNASKSAIKLKELPRLSLDSRERSIRRGCNPEKKGNKFGKDLQREDGNCNRMLDLQQEPGSSKRPSNVVAKLMGLDLSDSVSTNASPLRLINTFPSDRSDPLFRSSRANNENMPDFLSGVFIGNIQKDFSSPQRRSGGSVMKSATNSKFPIETAPWRHPHRCKGSQRAAFKYQEEPVKIPKSSTSVYGEMEKRLANLEFKKSGKDLRALKQILEAMQKTKEMFDNRKDSALNLASQTSNKSIYSDCTASESQRNVQGNMSVPVIGKDSQSPKIHQRSIIIMKPAKLIETGDSGHTLGLQKLRTSDSANTRKGLAEKTARPLKPAQKPKVCQVRSEEKATSSSRSLGITSPRLQQRRHVLEKKSPPSSPSSNSSVTRRQNTRQSLEASTPGGRLGQKSRSLHQSNKQFRATSTSMREMSHQDDATSQQSESTISLNSHIDTEFTSIHQSDRTQGTQFNQNSRKQKAKPGKASSEQPSPVSVLDPTFYRDDSPSPVKKISNSFKDDEAQNLDVEEYDPLDLAVLSNSTMPTLGPSSIIQQHIDHKTLENLNHLIQNQLNKSSRPEESITGLLCDSKKPDHVYISDILLASGILRYLKSAWTTIELHASDHLINPHLFLALEEIKTKAKLFDDGETCKETLQPKDEEQIQRKLVFDVVHEFLRQKLVVEDPFKQWFTPHKQAEGKPRGQQLFRELCSGVDQLQRLNLNGSLVDEDDSLRNILLEDFMDKAQNWTKCDSEIPGIVLDVERLIFKDLITEIVSDDTVGLHGWSGGHCRQLFS